MAAERGQGESQRGTSVALSAVLAEYDRLAELSNDLQKTRVQLLQRHPQLNAELREHFRIEDFLRGETSGQRDDAAGGRSAATANIPSTTIEQFISRVVKSQLMTEKEIRDCLRKLPAGTTPKDGVELARTLIRAGKLTLWQAQLISKGIRGKLVLGNYVLLEKLGQGGMGAVFKARHRRLDRVVALKILSPALSKSPELVARFQREAKAAAKLNHPHIVTAFDADEVEGQHFLVTEYLAGQDLSSVVKSRGTLSTSEALEIIAQAARGLIYAHSHGVVHRDVKPSNILLGHDGTVKILDLGLARIWTEQEATRAQLTESGQLIGTVDFMSPEQASNPRDVDHRTDIYSLGLTLYFLLTGRAAYPGSTLMEKLLAHRDRPIPDLPSEARKYCPDLDSIFQRMVAKDRDQRYDSMDELVADLEGARHGRSGMVATSDSLKSTARKRIADGAIGEVRPSAETEVPRSMTVAEGPLTFRRKSRPRVPQASLRWLFWGACGLTLMSAIYLVIKQMGGEPEVADGDDPAAGIEPSPEPTPPASTEVMLAVQRLISADADEVLGRIDDLAEHNADVVKPLVLQAFMDAEESSRQRLNCSLAMLHEDASQLDYLYGRLLDAEEDEYLLLTEALHERHGELVTRLWSDASSGMLDDRQRLRIYCALAAFDPDGLEWDASGSDVVEALHSASASDLFWEDQLTPVALRLIPSLTEAYASDDPSMRMMATRLLLREDAENVEALAALIPVSSAEQLDVLLESLTMQRAEAVAELQPMLAESRATEFEMAERANVAATLIRLGEPQPAWEAMLSDSEPELLKYMLANGTQLNLTATDWQSGLPFASTSAARHLLLIALGGEWDALDQTAQDEVVETARHSFAEAPSVAEHSAAEWLLRLAGDDAWMEESLSELAIEGMTDSRDWYVSPNGITLAIFEIERDAAEEPARRFAISTHEITGEQYGRFVEAHPDFSLETDEGMPPGMRESIRALQEQLSQATQHELPANYPRVNVNWFETAAFCRWLSDEEQLDEAEMCFPRIEQFEPVQMWAQGGTSFEFSSERPNRPSVIQQEVTTFNTNEHVVLTLHEDALTRGGYRLPTVGEWNVALSGGPSSEAMELVEEDFQNDWLWEDAQGSVQPPGRLPPDEHGMFDLLGNVHEWCLNGETDSEAEADGAIQYGEPRYVSGYSVNVPIESVTPDHLWAPLAYQRANTLGFRVARTLEAR